MVFSIDHGNKNMKTRNFIFGSGILENEGRTGTFGETLIFDNKYYNLTETRIPYMRDKTTDNRFFVLTLFAIAKEMELLNEFNTGAPQDIVLLTGLPPAHYTSQYETFEQYFRSFGETVNFTYNTKEITVNIKDVYCYPQAYAAAMSADKVIEEIGEECIVIDIGGYTFDYIKIIKGVADLSVCDSLDEGTITLYNTISSRINGKYGLLLTDTMIDAIILKKNSAVDEEICKEVLSTVQAELANIFGKLRERKIDLKINPFVFVGGGSILLKGMIEEMGIIRHKTFVDDIKGNVSGYDKIYKLMKG